MHANIGDAAVGAAYRKFSDSSREDWVSGGSRPIVTTVWYPAYAASKPRRQVVGPFQTGRYQIGACWRSGTEKLPLVVLSHGTGGSAASIAWLGVRLASRGFVVAAVNHHGNTAAEKRPVIRGFLRWWERPMDLSFVVDSLLADEEIGDHLDPARIGVAGFSLGGYTALATVGVTLDVRRWAPHCVQNPADPLCRLPPEAGQGPLDVKECVSAEFDERAVAQANQSYLDSRFKAAFVIALVGGPIMTDESVAAVAVPVSIVVGAEDDQSIAELTGVPIGTAIRQSWVEVLPGVHHYAFLSEGTLPARLFLRRIFADPRNLNRNQLHNDVASRAADFFRNHI